MISTGIPAEKGNLELTTRCHKWWFRRWSM